MSTTIVTDHAVAEVPEAVPDGDGLWLPLGRLEAATGWSLKPEGLCRGEVCVPVPPARRDALVRDGRADLAALWRMQDKPVAASDAGDVWVLGEAAADRAAGLASLEAPDFALRDLAGTTHRMSDHRGRKVLLATWASW
jgi:hypothetical protein